MLSHGNGFAIDGYFSFWSRFLGSFDVVVFDMRSHGQNPRAEPPNHDYAHMVPDLDGICRAVGEEFGEKPTAGVFHSMSAQCAMLQALAGRSDFAALILFDPPDVPPPGHPVRGKMEDYEHKLARWARQRRTHFDERSELARAELEADSGRRHADLFLDGSADCREIAARVAGVVLVRKREPQEHARPRARGRSAPRGWVRGRS